MYVEEEEEEEIYEEVEDDVPVIEGGADDA